jgi:hypothetical protein
MEERSARVFIMTERVEEVTVDMKVTNPYVNLEIGLADLNYVEPVEEKSKKKSAPASVIIIAASIGVLITGSCLIAFMCMMRNAYKKKLKTEEEESEEVEEAENKLQEEQLKRRKEFIERKKTITKQRQAALEKRIEPIKPMDEEAHKSMEQMIKETQKFKKTKSITNSKKLVVPMDDDV